MPVIFIFVHIRYTDCHSNQATAIMYTGYFSSSASVYFYLERKETSFGRYIGTGQAGNSLIPLSVPTNETFFCIYRRELDVLVQEYNDRIRKVYIWTPPYTIV